MKKAAKIVTYFLLTILIGMLFYYVLIPSVNLNIRYLTSKNTTPKTEFPLNAASINIDFNLPNSALTVFERGKYIWFIFDNYQDINPEKLKDNSDDFISEIVIIPNSEATIIRLKPKEKAYTLVRKSGDIWSINLSNTPQSIMIKKFSVIINNDSLYIPELKNSHIINFIDPEIGDTIFIATAKDFGIGHNQRYKFPDFEILPSSQGIAIVPNTNEIFLQSSLNGLEIKSAKKLNISPDITEKKEKEIYKSYALLNQPIHEFLSNTTTDENFVLQEEELQQSILRSQAEYKSLARLELAGYYVSTGLGTKAAPILEKLYEAAVSEKEKAKIIQILGITNFLNNNYDLALQNFTSSEKFFPEAAQLWQNILSTLISSNTDSISSIEKNINTINMYPLSIRMKVYTDLLPILVSNQKYDFAKEIITLINPQTNTLASDFYTAQILHKTNLKDDAIKIYEKLTLDRDIKYSSLARRELVKISSEDKSSNIKEIINEYEKLQYSWGEKAFKVQLLFDLGDLYHEQKDFINELKTLQHLLPLITRDEKNKLIDRMQNTFEEYYKNPSDEQHSIIKSLALYYDYEWLAKSSPEYNQISLSIIKQLISVDLIDRAEILLNKQLNDGVFNKEEQTEYMLTQALIFLLKKQHMEALEILRPLDENKISTKHNFYRTIITANAILSLGQEFETVIPDEKKEMLIQILSLTETLHKQIDKDYTSTIDLDTASDYDIIKAIKIYKQNLVNGIYK